MDEAVELSVIITIHKLHYSFGNPKHKRRLKPTYVDAYQKHNVFSPFVLFLLYNSFVVIREEREAGEENKCRKKSQSSINANCFKRHCQG